MAYPYRELQKKSDDELIALYDRNIESMSYGIDYLRQELALRSQERATEAMLRYTKQVTLLTWLTTFFAAGAFVFSIIALLHH